MVSVVSTALSLNVVKLTAANNNDDYNKKKRLAVWYYNIAQRITHTEWSYLIRRSFCLFVILIISNNFSPNVNNSVKRRCSQHPLPCTCIYSSLKQLLTTWLVSARNICHASQWVSSKRHKIDCRRRTSIDLFNHYPGSIHFLASSGLATEVLMWEGKLLAELSRLRFALLSVSRYKLTFTI